MDFIQFISAAGIGGVIGSLITTAFQAWTSHKQYVSSRNFQEKKEAYIGYIQSLHESEVKQDKNSALNVGHWKNRCELVASREILQLMEKMLETNPEHGEIHAERPIVLRKLREAMRRDLGVQI